MTLTDLDGLQRLIDKQREANTTYLANRDPYGSPKESELCAAAVQADHAVERSVAPHLPDLIRLAKLGLASEKES